MRLIDADKFKDWIDCGYSQNPDEKCFSKLEVRIAIDLQPTAFDVNNVYEQLLQKLNQYHTKAEFYSKKGMHDEWVHMAEKAAGYDHALDIILDGYVGNDKR